MADSQPKGASLDSADRPAIERRILVIRERQVMLDEDLAELYGVETRVLVQQVRRLTRFPRDGPAADRRHPLLDDQLNRQANQIRAGAPEGARASSAPPLPEERQLKARSLASISQAAFPAN